MSSPTQGQAAHVAPQHLSFLAHEVPDELGVSRVPDLVAHFKGPLEDVDNLPGELLDAAESVEHLVRMAVWWDQSGRPTGAYLEPGDGLWTVLDALATAAKAGGIHEGCRAFSQIPPKGEWWDTETRYEEESFGDDVEEADKGLVESTGVFDNMKIPPLFALLSTMPGAARADFIELVSMWNEAERPEVEGMPEDGVLWSVASKVGDGIREGGVEGALRALHTLELNGELPVGFPWLAGAAGDLPDEITVEIPTSEVRAASAAPASESA